MATDPRCAEVARVSHEGARELCDALDMKYEDNTLGGCSREPTPPQPTKADANL